MIFLQILGMILVFACGIGVGIGLDFDWQAFFKYKKDIVELGMKYEKEMQNEN